VKLRDADRKGAEVEAKRIVEDNVRDAMIGFEMIAFEQISIWSSL
jgi:hypothetical protein